MPRLERYSDLTMQPNLKILIDHVCAFVERNQVQWPDLHSRPVIFNRSAILMEVMITIQCFCFKEKYTAKKKGKEATQVGGPFYLLAIFDAIMNTMTKVNGKKIWMCKSMGMSQFHELLLSFYGKERLRYIYLVRDPRDVCLSFMKTPVGDCHPYVIAKKWAKLQNFAAHILQDTPELIHQVCYEEVLGNKEAQVAKIVKFMGARNVCRSMRRGSIIAIKTEEEVVSSARVGRESLMARNLSCQFQNLVRGDSFLAGQFKKWATEMEDEDIIVVESVAFREMTRLGYEPHLVKFLDDRIDFTGRLGETYDADNAMLIEKMNADLAVDNPYDLKRRQIQAAVLEKRITEHYEKEFVKSPEMDIEEALDSVDAVQNGKGFLFGTSFNFEQWPMNASLVGFQTDSDVSERFHLQGTQVLKLKSNVSIKFAAASQGGYYPHEKDKVNQDAFIAGTTVHEVERNSQFKKERPDGILFAVFDGHGPNGADCARRAQEYVNRQFVADVKVDTPSTRGYLNQSSHIASSLHSTYRGASSLLESGEAEIDAAQSGTTATSLFITKDLLHTANVGDSRCLLIHHNKKGKEISVNALTIDHTPEREDEINRIKACGGVIMTSDQYDTEDPNLPSSEQKRIWSKDGKWPGTAFTRSIGDALAKELGVCADPECADFPIPASDATFVLGSDGVFDFIPDEEIGAIVNKHKDPADACRELVGKAYNRWCESEERTDDITVIVGHVKRSKSSSRGVLGKLRHRVAQGALRLKLGV